MLNNQKIVVLISLLLIVSLTNAKVKLPSILDNNMVLQQQTEVKLWGETKANSRVIIKTSWDKKTYAVKSDSNGEWITSVSTPQAGGPYEISINDGEELVLKNILIGEVWFCCGQSNMEMPMKGFDRQAVANVNDVIAKAKTSVPIRIYNNDRKDDKWINQASNKPEKDSPGSWVENTSMGVASASAAAYFFAKYLQDVLEVPIGIIVSTKGGSRVEAWMSKEALEPYKEVDLSHLFTDREIKNTTNTPCVLYNAKIAPFINFPIKGFLWYQGESNIKNADLYEQLVPAFVKDLRTKWNVGEFPFYYVQIAPFSYGNNDNTNAARLREVQFNHMKTIPNSGMVSTLDVGNSSFIHPVEKETVGNRLAYWALAKTYKKEGFGYCGPMYKSIEPAEGKIYVNFENAPNGVFPMWTSLDYFEIAGEDQVFYPAKAEVETSTCRLAVSSEKVPNPVAVRYSYKNYSGASIYDNFGLPAYPFRSDNW